MAPTLMQRKLTAILSADVVGYGGLIEADELGTLEPLKANRSLIFDPPSRPMAGVYSSSWAMARWSSSRAWLPPSIVRWRYRKRQRTRNKSSPKPNGSDTASASILVMSS